MKHTHGPWQVGSAVDNYGDTEITIEKITSSGSLLVAVAVGGLSGQEANARLIAAAPCLIEALNEAVADLDVAGFMGTASMCRAAIAKATGDAT